MTTTYNEKENVVRLVEEVNALGIACRILVVDDNSPDGTGEVAERLKEKHSNLIVLHRAGKLGIGSAHLDALRFAFKHGYRRLVTMDCDFTHSPSYIPKFLREADEYDLALGNRYLSLRNLADWPVHRRLFTKLVHFLTTLILGIPFDATNAFRCYNLETLSPKIFDCIRSMDYAFFFESLNRLWLAEVSAIEIPIHLPARALGKSKMTVKDIANALGILFVLLGWRLRRVLNWESTNPPASQLPAHASKNSESRR